MRKVFVDTLYFVALINKNDQWRSKSIEAKARLSDARFVTTEMVLIEVLNFLSEYGETLRKQVSLFVRDVLEDVEFDVVAYTETTLLNGLELYETRLDKGYSLTDCISMNVCREMGIQEILTHDRHFEQEGFSILL
ncbi:MAG: type II toxin-antitoxin system VapC family toxin [Acidobacteria bacterium]|nr:type II toxin-antitoxin system VapC family toxin [Acidobacteriota bacterium]